ncbi:hypothetical protein BJX70DRAFT_188472 [Aspergillus crustosus]
MDTLQVLLILFTFLRFTPVFAFLDDDKGVESRACPTDPWWIQPVTIDLGLDTITAAYAYSADNVTIIADLDTRNPSLNLTAYVDLIQNLRKQHLDDYKAQIQLENRHYLLALLEDYWSTVQESIYQYARGVWFSFLFTAIKLNDLFWDSSVIWFWPIKMVLKVPILAFMYLVPERILLIDAAEYPYSRATREVLTQALEVVRDAALKNGVNITHPIVLYPDFFSTQVQKLFDRAVYDAGFEILVWQTITQRQLLEFYGNSALFNQSADAFQGCVPRANQSSLLILNQGLGFFDLLTSGKHGLLSFPLEQISCLRILHNLWVKITAKYPLINEEVERGALEHYMSSELMRVRALFKEAKALNETQGFDDVGLLEWPLDLDGWWVGEKRGEVTLSWNHIEAVDDEYVWALGEWLDEAQLALQGACGYTDQPASSKSVDGVVIAGGYCDASLLSRAAKQSIGEHVKIFGPTSGADTSYLARLGASIALQMREKARREMEEHCRKQESHQQGAHDDDWDWYMEHDEL